MDEHKLVSLLSFAETRKIFFGTDDRNPFCLITFGNVKQPPSFSFSLSSPADLLDGRRRFSLSSEEVRIINPNTRTCPIFRTAYDAELTKKIFQRVPVLIDESKGRDGNPWSVKFSQGLFNMTSDSGLFRTHAQLVSAGATLGSEMAFMMPDGVRFVSLYEAKMIHHYDHRWSGYDATGEEVDLDGQTKADPSGMAMPRYWVAEAKVEARLLEKGWTRGWLMGWRDVCRSTDERTMICAIMPRVGVNHKTPLFLFDTTSDLSATFCGMTS